VALRRTNERASGFTLIEALVSMTIFLALLTAVLSAFGPSRELYTRGERKVDVQQNARLAVAEMSRQIRMAGYFAENFADAPPAPLVADPILVATDSALAIHGDADGSGASSVFLFCLDGTTLRRTQAGKAVENAYKCDQGEVLADYVTGLTFTYYDEDGDPIPNPPTAPYKLDNQVPGAVPELDDVTQRSAVRRVLITLTTETAVPGKETQDFTLNSNVWLRNAG
jgi:type II secretory pathway pseudopilin PulG